MKALINETNVNCKELLMLLKQKIEDCIINDQSVVINVSNSFMACRHMLAIEDYEIDEQRLYLNCGNFEFHLKTDEIKDIEYDNTYDECFMFHNDSTEIIVYFI